MATDPKSETKVLPKAKTDLPRLCQDCRLRAQNDCAGVKELLDGHCAARRI